ncbi:hypothetical protein HOA91_04600, partial [Candidatus Woesearchaeota archaeon]|nr:hypothetical protein [Candidatus Woesearchaeota archaeon]
MVDYSGMIYRKKWDPTYSFVDEQILIDGVSDNLTEIIHSAWNDTLRNVSPEPSNQWQSSAKKFVKKLRKNLPFAGVHGISSFGRNEYLLERSQKHYLRNFGDEPIPLTTLGRNKMINCIGQALSVKMALAELADWELYNCTQDSFIGTHGVLSLVSDDCALVLDPVSA